MNEIAEARASINQRVASYIQSHPDVAYSRIAQALGVSRWRVQTVAAGIGITRKSGPKQKDVPELPAAGEQEDVSLT